MVKFKAKLLRFGEMGEKTGWTYLPVSAAVANKIFPDCRKSFRVKGNIDDHPVAGLALIPMGGGDFILPFNAALRKATGKREGDTVNAQFEVDKKERKISKALLDSLAFEPEALKQFRSLPPSHQHYFSRWIEEGKSSATRAKRIARTVDAMLKKWNYAQMIRAGKNDLSGPSAPGR